MQHTVLLCEHTVWIILKMLAQANAVLCIYNSWFISNLVIHWYCLYQALSMDRESCQATSGHRGHPPHWRAPPSASGPRCPSFSGGRLSRVLLLSGERKPWPGCLHQGFGPHWEAPAAWWPPPAHRSPGRELLFRGAWGKDPCGPTERGPSLW